MNDDVDDYFDACDSCGRATGDKMYLLVSKKGRGVSAFCNSCILDLKRRGKLMRKRSDITFYDSEVERTIDDLFLVKTATK